MPDMREKVKEYIIELEEQINTHEKWLIEHKNADIKEEFIIRGSLATLVVIKDDLQSRLDELV